MNINEYLTIKSSVKLFTLMDHKSIQNFYDISSYKVIKSLDEIIKNPLSDNELLLLITDSKGLSNQMILKYNYGASDIMLLLINDSTFSDNQTETENTLFSYGYKYHGPSDDNLFQVFIYQISSYKDNPDWLNNENWANPELWEK